LYVPAASEESLKVAMSPLREAEPRVVDPLEKVTVPVAVPPYSSVTVAVKVTACPTVDGFGDDAKRSEVVAVPTWTETAFDVLPA
jgi:predicted small secreted protein